ncbi:MAG: shikimate dehydrogenase, partial [Gammaproteobacteria bacterium]|nr:shikimate dehydrogenase [Gammaproteobacteria bacterium]
MTDQYAVIGHPIEHSVSPFIHGLFARQTGQDMSYRKLDIAPENLTAEVRQFFLQGGRGLNVTVPHKQAIVEMIAELSPRAERAGAVNTVALQEDGRLFGDNTDGVGLVRDLRDNLMIDVHLRSVLI